MFPINASNTPDAAYNPDPKAKSPLPAVTDQFRAVAGMRKGEVAFADYPRVAFRTFRTNEKTGEVNLLHEFEWQLLFCTGLLFLDEGGAHLYLKHVVWALSYRASVSRKGDNEYNQMFLLHPVSGKCLARVDGPFDGPPANSQLRGVLDTPSPICMNTATRKANTERAESAADLSLAANPPDPLPFGGLPCGGQCDGMCGNTWRDPGQCRFTAASCDGSVAHHSRPTVLGGGDAHGWPGGDNPSKGR